MHEITITYQNLNYRRHLPDEWEKLKKEQLISYAYGLRVQGTDADKKRSILYKWLNIKPNVFFNLPVGTVNELCDLLDFMFEKDIASKKLILDSFTWGNRSYYGPGKDFCNMTVAEYAFAEQYMKLYLESGDRQHLQMMVPVLYRKSNAFTYEEYKEYNTDPRTLFSDKLLDRQNKELKALPPHVADAVYYNFAAYRQWVITYHEWMYKKVEADETGDGWAGVIHSLAGPELGDMDKVEKMSFNNCLVILRKLENDRLRMEEHLNKQQNILI